MAKKITHTEFINLSTIKHKNIYNYEKTKYINKETPVEIICSIHGSFTITAYKHLNGSGCNKCRIDKIRKKYTKTTSQFITEAIDKHGDFYDYSEVSYINNVTNVKIICKIHGYFLKIPVDHLSGGGCSKCHKDKLRLLYKSNTDEFISKAQAKHSFKYTYDKANYGKNAHEKVIITCPIHGDFEQSPAHHLFGRGCFKCSKSISKPEIKWLDYLGIDEKFRQKKIKINNRSFKLDAFDKEKNIIYEFYGDFWHGNLNRYSPDSINCCCKKSFQELNDNTKEREKILLDNGYHLVTIWESDWDQLNNVR
jgi:hypothetical protein